ncbi:EARP-interacting protein [Schistosoma japonicum]|uniref:EARP-interacting protein n=1 Tax=Schistosoma japonicum TaxID=6182 RepID=C1LE02_SCHJA|nr:EARP-interacting protein [Schistosoma japonicum]TNN13468.1 EARP-interacting protein [Schistosoma japonicum]TNN13469.1 EARP-interacting protein [Schistosoma japonicum]CAX72930.1 Protein TSSC1 [Schistosoma japonicum]
MKLSNFPPSSGIALQPNVRCLVGLYGSLKDSSSEDFNQLLEEDQDEQEILRYAINHDETDEVRFLVGSQSLKSQGSQITLVTLVESIDIDLKKQTFAHPHGEVTSLVLLPSKPDCFISLFTSYSNEQPELRTGARLWRISNLNENLLDDEINESDLSKSPLDHNNSSTMNNSLDYVTTLPLDKYYGIKRITSHPSTTSSDLACIVGPPVEMSGSTAYSSFVTTAATSYLVILQAPSNSNSGDYQISTSVQLYLPPSSPSDGLRTNMKSSSCLSATASPNAIRWSPHEHLNQLAMAFDNGILGWDTRCMKPCFWMENANWPCVRDIDYNPHRPNLLISGGDDGILRLWDLRYLRTRYRCLSTNTTAAATNTHIPNASERIMQYGTEPTVQPLFAIASHSHWIWSVRYHPTRDQLVLSSGSDGRVCLYNLPSYSSDALLNNDIKGQPANNHSQMELPDEHDDHSSCCSHEDEIDKNEDGLIARLEQHEESVYAVEWSPVDAWYFASISYDGNFLINRVPDQIKLNILLQSNDY